MSPIAAERKEGSSVKEDKKKAILLILLFGVVSLTAISCMKAPEASAGPISRPSA
jgi:hypothetical protein